eukprot:484219-Rhodomonas_salina.1
MKYWFRRTRGAVQRRKVGSSAVQQTCVGQYGGTHMLAVVLVGTIPGRVRTCYLPRILAARAGTPAHSKRVMGERPGVTVSREG